MAPRRRSSARSTPRWPDAPPEQVAALVIAYEPIWAIGTGRTATADDAQAVIGAIRGRVAALSGEAAAAAVRIQYGGSVKAANIVELMAQPDIDGALVGGASLDPDEFARIVNFRRARPLLSPQRRVPLVHRPFGRLVRLVQWRGFGNSLTTGR